MIRDLTKSAVSFSWALSLLTLKQAVNMATPGKQGGGDLFAPITQAAVGQLNEGMRGFYRCGDGLQSRMVDMTFSMLNPMNWFNPNTWNIMRSMGSMGGCGPTAGSPGQPTSGPGPSGAPPGGAPAGGGAPVSNQTAAAGWGPMP